MRINTGQGSVLGPVGTGVLALMLAVAPPSEAQVGSSPRDTGAWKAEELFRLGGLDVPPEQQFTNHLLSLSLGPNDQLFVLDLSSNHVQVFSALDGQHVRTIAGPGRGPGEILDATSLGWDPEHRLWVKEPFGRRFSVFDSMGTFLRTVPRPWAPVPRRTGRVEFDRRGRLVEMASENSRPRLRVLNPQTGEIIEEYAGLPPLLIHSSLPEFFVGLPDAVVEAIRRFRPLRIWDWTADGRVWMAREDEYRIVVVDARGDTLDVVKRLARTREFSRQEEALVHQARTHLKADDDFLSPPQLQSIIRLPDGHLLVQRPDEMNEPGSLFDIFDPGGGYLGELELPLPVWPRSGVAARGDRLFVVGRGEYDVPIILALSLRR